MQGLAQLSEVKGSESKGTPAPGQDNFRNSERDASRWARMRARRSVGTKGATLLGRGRLRLPTSMPVFVVVWASRSDATNHRVIGVLAAADVVTAWTPQQRIGEAERVTVVRGEPLNSEGPYDRAEAEVRKMRSLEPLVI
uniref:Uncharacterized protein n=1 Tax=Plectus sambesii TaxID=2011161 RepID=A0A914WNX3_9BILA